MKELDILKEQLKQMEAARGSNSLPELKTIKHQLRESQATHGGNGRAKLKTMKHQLTELKAARGSNSRAKMTTARGSKNRACHHEQTFNGEINMIDPNPDKHRNYRILMKNLAAFADFPTPKNTTDVKSFLGLACQLGAFHCDIQQMLDKMKNLTKKDVPFIWTPEIDREFKLARRILSGPSVVTPYDPDLETELVTDASRVGMGFALMQRKKWQTKFCQDCKTSWAAERKRG